MERFEKILKAMNKTIRKHGNGYAIGHYDDYDKFISTSYEEDLDGVAHYIASRFYTHNLVKREMKAMNFREVFKKPNGDWIQSNGKKA